MAGKLLLGNVILLCGLCIIMDCARYRPLCLCLVRKVGGAWYHKAKFSELGWNMGTRACMYPAHLTLCNGFGVGLHNDL